ncbi:MAG TPA: mannose-1-phosphate guanylyltransferase/mannose-6-phosphate isomerase, partial [Rubrivivax sp.]|nr:mannose-1-phosphate guanylyltransferase/mannose-6-phosphate isomerase [Rubrivivax sp.]
MMNDKPTVQVQPVVMAGGSGTRLWPLSRAGFPKQFLVLSGTSSLFQQAVQRLQAIGGDGLHVAAPVIVGNEEHRFLVLDQLRELKTEPGAVLLEPIGRNTAPAVTLAALQALEDAAEGADPVLVVTPADQTVTDDTAFTSALRGAVQMAAAGAITILGIRPDRPETGYGYIRADGVKVAQFVEKPDLATAQKYVADGGYFWNAGMFVLKASVWMAALERFRPDIATACRAAFAARSTDAKFVRPGKAEFAAVPADSVDYAVMEKCPGVLDIRMQELGAGWNDLGAWEAVWQVAEKDGQGNASTGDAIMSDSRNTLVHATSRLVSVVGLEDVVIVETPDAVLVANREKSQDVKNIVNQLGREKRGEQMLHRKVHRPWGWYDSIDSGPRHQVKRILVKPGASLSLQMHHHRAEHWIVVSGTPEVTNG